MGIGLEEGAEVAAHEMGHADCAVQGRPAYGIRRSSEPRMCRVLLHDGNTAGLACSVTICPALP